MSGDTAVRNGLRFEAKVYTALKAVKGVNIIRNIPYPSIYSAFGKPPFTHHTRMEFRAENISLAFKTLDQSGNEVTVKRRFHSLNIECKYQEEGGSVDEKYPLVYQNALISDAEATLFIYEDPNGKIKQGALNYMQHVALHSNERLIVLEYSDFLKSIYNYHTYTMCERIMAIASDPVKELPVFTKAELNHKDIDAMHRDFVDEYNQLGKAANQLFRNALNHQWFWELFGKYLDMKHELAEIHLRYGYDCRYRNNRYGQIAEEALGLMHRLERGLAELNRDLFSE